MNLSEFYVTHVKSSVENANKHISKISQNSEILNIDGMSSEKNRHLLNNICSILDARYLEIGTWKGSTLLSALYKNGHVNATCIENFSEFTGPKNEFLKNTKFFLEQGNIPNFEFIESDCFSINVNNIKKKNLYFFDGGHEIEDHVKAFTYFNDVFDDVFICVIDDWNHKHNNVKIGTEIAFKELNYQVQYEVALPAKYNGDRELWWNGLYIAVVKK